MQLHSHNTGFQMYLNRYAVKTTIFSPTLARDGSRFVCKTPTHTHTLAAHRALRGGSTRSSHRNSGGTYTMGNTYSYKWLGNR